MLRYSFNATIRDGKLHIMDEKAFRRYLFSFRDGENLKVTVWKRSSQRSLPQNAWYWGAVLPIIAEETGHSAEELHEIFKRMFLPPKTVRFRGRDFRMPGSTKDCNVAEFHEYIEKVRAEASSMGIEIPDPDSFAS